MEATRRRCSSFQPVIPLSAWKRLPQLLLDYRYIHPSIHLTSIHLTSIHLTSIHLTSIHLTSIHLTSIHLSITNSNNGLRLIQDTWVSLISAQQIQVPLRFIEVAVKQCRNGGIDCKVHGIQLVGRNVGNALPLDDSAALAQLLPPDFELEQVLLIENCFSILFSNPLT